MWIVECVVQDGEDALQRDGVGRVGQHCAQHKSKRVDALALLVLAPEFAEVKGVALP